MTRHRIHPDRCAPDCDDQLPLISRVGRGLQGDSYKVEVASDSNCETILEGMRFDAASKEWKSEWLSENVNGGCLSYQYVLRPHTIPQTFTITFIYRRPGRKEWSWTTPAIPYVWSASDTGEPEDPDHIVGSGVATLYVKTTTDPAWTEKLVYPEGTGPEDYNTPDPNEPWTVNLSFGVGGDVEVPNLDDLAKVIGITVEDIEKIIAGDTVEINGVDASDLIDYIDKQDDSHQKAALDHLHADLGFDEGFLPGDGGDTSVKEYIDAIKGDATLDLGSLESYVKNALGDILAKIYLGGTLGDDGHITWPNTNKIPIGDLNIFSNSNPTDATVADAIRSRALSDDDIRTI